MFQQLKWLDLTHPLTNNSPSWEKTGCGFSLHTNVDYKDCKGAVKFRVQDFKSRSGMGTHIDAPSHCIPGGREIHQLVLSELISECVVIRAKERGVADSVFTKEDILDFEQEHGFIPANSFVLFDSGWATYWSSPDKYHNDYHYPSIDVQVAKYLLSKDIAGIGIDTLSPDLPSSGFLVHEVLLGANKYIVENVNNAEQLPIKGATTFALPMMIDKGTEAPLRLIAALP